MPERPCPRMADFPAELRQEVTVVLAAARTLAWMIDPIAADRAFNRAICG